MSFFSHIGLSIVDKITGNALDKVGNAIKDGDVSELIKQFRGLLEGVEDKLGDVSELFEDAIDDAKKDVRREVTRMKRKLVRETRQELETMHDQFLDALRPTIAELVEAEVSRRLDQFVTLRFGIQRRLTLWARRRKRNPSAARGSR